MYANILEIILRTLKTYLVQKCLIVSVFVYWSVGRHLKLLILTFCMFFNFYYSKCYSLEIEYSSNDFYQRIGTFMYQDIKFRGRIWGGRWIMKALSTLQNESFVKNHWKQSILQNKSFIKGLVPNASSSETGFGGSDSWGLWLHVWINK